MLGKLSQVRLLYKMWHQVLSVDLHGDQPVPADDAGGACPEVSGISGRKVAGDIADIFTETSKPVYHDYATLTELIDAEYAQKSMRIPVKTWKNDAGEVQHESFFLYTHPGCSWLSRLLHRIQNT